MAAVTALPESDIDRIFGPLVQARTYRHFIYFALSFPLGILYFVTMITGLSVGAGLAILFVGFVIVALTLALARGFASLERWLTGSLLEATFQPSAPSGRGLRAALTDRQSWTRVIYLLLRFPIGIAGLVGTVLFLTSIVIIAAPVLYNVLPYVVVGERITTSEEALLVSLFGCLLLLGAAHAINALAALTRRIAEKLI